MRLKTHCLGHLVREWEGRICRRRYGTGVFQASTMAASREASWTGNGAEEKADTTMAEPLTIRRMTSTAGGRYSQTCSSVGCSTSGNRAVSLVYGRQPGISGRRTWKTTCKDG